MTLLKYQPFADVDDFSVPLRMFQDSLTRLMGEPGSRPWTPAVDIFETENELVLKADVPELALKDIDIRMENGTLTLKGERRFEREGTDQGYHRIERSYGAFSRSFAVPDSVDPDKVRAEYKDGVLTVTLPKKEVAKPRAIKVDVSQ